MPMMIKQIREYFPNQGYRSGYKYSGNTSGTLYVNVPVQSIRAVRSQNLQIYAYAYSNAAKLKVRSTSILDVPDSDKVYVVEFGFDGNLIPNNIVTTEFQPQLGATQQNALIAKISNLTTDKYFAMIAVGAVTLTSDISNALMAIGAIYSGTTTLNSEFTFVAVGYNKAIIDSIWNGNDAGGASQLYINGQNAALGQTVSRADTISASPPYSATSATYAVSLPNDGGKYYQVDFTTPVAIDYIIFSHNNNIDPFIIQNHQIDVVDGSNNIRTVKQPSNGFVEYRYGSRFYLFASFTSDQIITGGTESTVAMSGTIAAMSRMKNQGCFTGFLDEKYMASNTANILANFTLFEKPYSPGSTSDNGGKIEGQDIVPAIRDAERIKYGLAGCTDSTCSFACFDNCTVTCQTTCGTNCGTNCNLRCILACGFTNCSTVCVGVCAGTCGTYCQGGCAAICAGGTCGSNCTAVCTGACTGQCYDHCTSSCYGACTSPALWCVSCFRQCDGVCMEGCGGTCASGCSGRNCGNDCGHACGTSSCYNTCGATCSTACGTACTGHACIGNCNNGCSTACTIVCSTACQSSCTSTCTSTCIDQASATKPAYI